MQWIKAILGIVSGFLEYINTRKLLSAGGAIERDKIREEQNEVVTDIRRRQSNVDVDRMLKPPSERD